MLKKNSIICFLLVLLSCCNSAPKKVPPNFVVVTTVAKDSSEHPGIGVSYLTDYYERSKTSMSEDTKCLETLDHDRVSVWGKNMLPSKPQHLYFVAHGHTAELKIKGKDNYWFDAFHLKLLSSAGQIITLFDSSTFGELHNWITACHSGNTYGYEFAYFHVCYAGPPENFRMGTVSSSKHYNREEDGNVLRSRFEYMFNDFLASHGVCIVSRNDSYSKYAKSFFESLAICLEKQTYSETTFGHVISMVKSAHSGSDLVAIGADGKNKNSAKICTYFWKINK